MIQKHLCDADFRGIAATTDATIEPAHMMSYGGYRFNAEGFRRLLALAYERQAIVDAKADTKKAAYELKVVTSLRTAAETRKPVEIESWTENCDGSAYECSTDIITRYAMPDGSVDTRRTHAH